MFVKIYLKNDLPGVKRESYQYYHNWFNSQRFKINLTPTYVEITRRYLQNAHPHVRGRAHTFCVQCFYKGYDGNRVI